MSTSIRSPLTPARSRIDVPAAGRLIANSIPKRQHLPSVAADTPATSAAALAAEQAYDATRANRFRFVAKEGEKLIPGEDDDEDDAEAAANSLLDSVEADIVASEVAPKKKSSKSKATKAKPAKKRKRAE